MSRIKAMAVLAACERVIRNWPVAARIAFRDAVLADVTQFVTGEWDPIEAQLRAEIFGARWQRGQPWPPHPDELAVAAPSVLTFDRAAVEALARRIRALGVQLARASR